MLSSSRASNQSTTDNRVFDNRIAADGGALVARADGGDVTIYQTSDEAVALGTAYADAAQEMLDGGFDTVETVAREAGYLGEAALERAFQFADNANADAANTTQRAVATLAHTTSEAIAESREDSLQLTQDLMRFGIPAALGALVLIYLMGKK